MQDSLKNFFLLLTIKFISSFHSWLQVLDACFLENVVVIGYQNTLYKFGILIFSSCKRRNKVCSSGWDILNYLLDLFM